MDTQTIETIKTEIQSLKARSKESLTTEVLRHYRVVDLSESDKASLISMLLCAKFGKQRLEEYHAATRVNPVEKWLRSYNKEEMLSLWHAVAKTQAGGGERGVVFLCHKPRSREQALEEIMKVVTYDPARSEAHARLRRQARTELLQCLRQWEVDNLSYYDPEKWGDYCVQSELRRGPQSEEDDRLLRQACRRQAERELAEVIKRRPRIESVSRAAYDELDPDGSLAAATPVNVKMREYRVYRKPSR